MFARSGLLGCGGSGPKPAPFSYPYLCSFLAGAAQRAPSPCRAGGEHSIYFEDEFISILKEDSMLARKVTSLSEGRPVQGKATDNCFSR